MGLRLRYVGIRNTVVVLPATAGVGDSEESGVRRLPLAGASGSGPSCPLHPVGARSSARLIVDGSSPIERVLFTAALQSRRRLERRAHHEGRAEPSASIFQKR